MAAAAAAAAAGDTSCAVWAELRLADAGDVRHIHGLIRQMAEFERLTHLFSATEAALASSLFPSSPSPPPPFLSFTVLILDLLPSSPPSNPNPSNPSSPFPPVSRRIDLPSPVADPDAAAFASARGGGGVVAGFVLCFPNYSSFLAKPGLYVEDIFVRAPWRRRGLGRMMLGAVAAQAARMGMGRVEWCVLDWNAAAVDFYKQMGADVLPMWRICRLAGPKLHAYADADADADAQGEEQQQQQPQRQD